MLLYQNKEIKVVSERRVRDILSGELYDVRTGYLPWQELTKDTRCIFTHYINKAVLEMQELELEEYEIKAQTWELLIEKMCHRADFKLLTNVRYRGEAYSFPFVIEYYNVPPNHPLLRQAKLHELLK